MTSAGKTATLVMAKGKGSGSLLHPTSSSVVANNAASGVRAMTSSYRLKSAPSANRPSTATYAMGTFSQDYEYSSGSGDLDECNGRTGVTPEFPAGIYHYYVTDTYPYLQRCVKGTL